MSDPASGTVAIILAAGLGTRMRSRLPKLLHPLCGRPMLAYVLEVAREVSPALPVVVYSPATQALCEVFADGATFALQGEPLGTGDALRAGLAAVPAEAAEVLVLSGDTPLLTAATVRGLAERRRRDGAALTLATMRPEDPHGYGRVVRQGRHGVARIVEEKDADRAERAIGEVNAGLYAFEAAWLRGRIGDLQPSPVTGEIYLTGLVALAHADGRRVTAFEVEDEQELAGINDRVQLATAEADLRWQILERHLLAGVTMLDPTTVYVDAGVELARDVTLEPNVILRGRTRVGEGSVIGAGSQLFDTTVGERCRIWDSVLESSEVEDEVQVGPFAHLRPGSSIGRGARLGNFAEVKNSRLGPGVQQHHMSYLGDAQVGARTNVGAGTITANYDGSRKLATTIGEGVFLGVDTMLVAPLEVGDGARTGAGAVVTHDVPPHTLVVGVPARIREPHGDTPAPAGPDGGPESA